jgi:hypothetical protein
MCSAVYSTSGRARRATSAADRLVLGHPLADGRVGVAQAWALKGDTRKRPRCRHRTNCLKVNDRCHTPSLRQVRRSDVAPGEARPGRAPNRREGGLRRGVRLRATAGRRRVPTVETRGRPGTARAGEGPPGTIRCRRRDHPSCEPAAAMGAAPLDCVFTASRGQPRSPLGPLGRPSDGPGSARADSKIQRLAVETTTWSM